MKRVFVVSEKYHSGGGTVKFKWQRKQGNFLATTGASRTVFVFDRRGDIKGEISLPGVCTGLEWDKDGDILAIIQDKSGIVYLWDANTHRTTQLDSGMKDQLTFLTWSRVGPQLAIGTGKGNLLLYNHQTSRKIPVMGKHSKRITCGAWNAQNLLAMGSEDRSISVSTADGDAVNVASVRAEPSALQFSEMKSDEKSPREENTVSAIVGKKTLFLLNINDPESPIELAFQNRYGNIVSYQWYGDGHLLIGFSNGFFIVISTHKKEIGQEMFQARNHKDTLTSTSVSLTLQKVATCGDNCVKIHDLADLKEMYAIITIEDDQSRVDRMEWTDDGQLLAVSMQSGNIFTYLTKLPFLGDACGTRLAYLTSLLEVTVANEVEEEPPVRVELKIEPTFVSVGPDHLAVGMNNRVWFYLIGEAGPELLSDKECLGTVNKMLLGGAYAAVLYDNKLQLHLIEADSETGDDRESRLFPDRGSGINITCAALTSEFLIFGSESGSLLYFFIEDWQYVNEFRHVVGIRGIYPDPTGTRVVLVDDKSDGLLYNPINDAILEVPNFSPSTNGVLWENYPPDRATFCTFDSEKLYTYAFYRDTVSGPHCQLIGTTKLPFAYHPLMLHNGDVSCVTQSGKVANVRLSTHSFLTDPGELSSPEMRTAFEQCLLLKRFSEAWAFATGLNSKEVWCDFAKAALHHLDVELAIRVYRRIGDVGMVWSLQGIQGIENKNLLSGYIAMYSEDFNLAQELFLSSSKPVAALEMRRDLLHWEQALQLANKLAPDQIPYISRQYAQQLEFTGDYSGALYNYETAITKKSEDSHHDESCLAGVARTSIRNGDIQKGVSLAFRINNKQLHKDCANQLEDMKQYVEAATLYEKAQCYDKAAALYIKSKNWTKVGELLGNVTSPKIHGQYAKAKEADGQYRDAAAAYENARDYDSVIRVNLDFLNNPDEAVRIVRETQSVDGAKLVARYFEKLGDFSSAMEFLVLSKCSDEAFAMAQAHRQMEQYAEIVGDEASEDEYLAIADYFVTAKRMFNAGKFFLKAGQYAKAVHHLILPTVGDNSKNIELAIEAVGQAQNEQLTYQLIDYLMGEADGLPKDAKYLFRLYMALQQYREAARTAIIIAREDQNSGNYRQAHDVLFSMYEELRKHKIRIPNEMEQNLMMLHSYILVKVHVKLGDHRMAARMLIRVANSISKFPTHVVPILTSTVVECQRAGLKNSAFGYAAMLMRPEYRQKIDAKYKKKIEQIVRKPDKSEDEEPSTPCPFCGNSVPETKLYCAECKNNLPYCIFTGRHMVKEDWTICPQCDFPALHSEFVRYSETDGAVCPMNGKPLSCKEISLVADPSSYLKAMTEVTEE